MAYKRFRRGDLARISNFNVKGICADKDKTIMVGEVVIITDEGYYGCYKIESQKDKIKALTSHINLEKIEKINNK